MEETSLPRVDTKTDASDASFFLLFVLSLVPISILPLVAGPDMSTHHWTLTLLGSAIKIGLLCYTLLVVRGFYVWWRGPLPLQKDETAKYISVKSGRIIEYYVYGSEKEDATALVILHGSGSTGKYFNQFLLPDSVLKKLNVKAISPSYPGHGGSDPHYFRRITDYPLTDLVPILDNDGVDKFLCIGASYGTSHGMAIASAMPDRCLGLGLNVPYLPENICREANVWTDADMILRENQLKKPWILLPIMGVFGMIQWLIPTGICSYSEGKKILNEFPELFDVLQKDAARSFLRGVNGQIYEMLNAETTQTWPDPRQIKAENIALWYAQDDSIVPPDHGMWLEKSLSTDGRKLNVKKQKNGLGHFTYMTPEYNKTAGMTKVLMEMIASSKKDE